MTYTSTLIDTQTRGDTDCGSLSCWIVHVVTEMARIKTSDMYYAQHPYCSCLFCWLWWINKLFYTYEKGFLRQKSYGTWGNPVFWAGKFSLLVNCDMCTLWTLFCTVKALQKKRIIPFFPQNLIHYSLTAVYTGYNLQSSVINKAVTHTQFPMYWKALNRALL